jgi:hypothetical protein
MAYAGCVRSFANPESARFSHYGVDSIIADGPRGQEFSLGPLGRIPGPDAGDPILLLQDRNDFFPTIKFKRSEPKQSLPHSDGIGSPSFHLDLLKGGCGNELDHLPAIPNIHAPQAPQCIFFPGCSRQQ